MLFCRNYFPLLENAKLNTVSHHLGIAFNHHHALADALACATLLLTVNKELESPSIRALFQHVGITPGFVFEKGYQAPKRGKSMVTSQASPHSVTSSPFNSQTDFFKHQTVVITGPLQSMTRAEAIAIIGHLGGTVGSSVITGGQKIYELSPEEMTTKLKKAITLVYHGQDILFLTENEFLSILRGE